MSPPNESFAGPKLMLLGAGGHGRVLADAAIAAGLWGKVAATDRNPALGRGELLEGVEVLPLVTLADLAWQVHIAIGNNAAREREASAVGWERLAAVVHPAATVSRFSILGRGSFIAAGSVIAPGVVTGAGTIVNHGSVLDHDVQVGAFTHVAPRGVLGGGVSLGRRVLLGAGAIVLPGLRIGDDITIGAGAVVTTNLDEAGTYVGIPARKLACAA